MSPAHWYVEEMYILVGMLHTIDLLLMLVGVHICGGGGQGKGKTSINLCGSSYTHLKQKVNNQT